MTDGSNMTKQQPQFSGMFQKVALAFKSKTFELFSDETTEGRQPESFISVQKVASLESEPPSVQSTPPQDFPLDSHLALGLISSIFATVSAFEASYLQLQHNQAPFDEDGIRAADTSLVGHLKKLSDYKMLYRELRMNPGSGAEFLVSSCLEAQVDDNQSKLRLLGFVSDRLQAEIDRKDTETESLRKRLGMLTKSNLELSKSLMLFACNRDEDNNFWDSPPSSSGIVLSLKIFTHLLNETRRSIHKFSKMLVGAMKRARWDINTAASTLYATIKYSSESHSQYALLSYVSLGMFSQFDDKEFGISNEDLSVSCGSIRSRLLGQMVEHLTSTSGESPSTKSDEFFSRFCERKYDELVHPSMESSIFRDFDEENTVLASWKSSSIFYKSFVDMANAVLALHKLAFCFEPNVEIFRVERDADFSAVYMEDVTKMNDSKLKVGFTVFPGFKIGRTVIQSQVYLNRRQL